MQQCDVLGEDVRESYEWPGIESEPAQLSRQAHLQCPNHGVVDCDQE